MKKLLFLLLFFSFGMVNMQAQTIGHNKIKDAKEIVWFGLDFSKVQCVGKAGFEDPEDVAKSKVHSWNELFITEHEKFNVTEAFKKDEFLYDIASADEQNEKVDPETLVVRDAKELERSDIESILSNYSSSKYEDGLGLMFVVEKLDKLATEAVVHVTFFDIKSKEIVKVVEYTGKPRGFGLRNFWAGAFYDVIGQLEDDYKKWYKKNK